MKCILTKEVIQTWTEVVWLRMGTNGGPLCYGCWTFRFSHHSFI